MIAVAVDPAFTTANLTALRRAMLRGIHTVTYDNRSVTYSTLDEMLQLEQRILRSLRTPRSKQYHGVAVKGFDRL